MSKEEIVDKLSLLKDLMMCNIPYQVSHELIKRFDSNFNVVQDTFITTSIVEKWIREINSDDAGKERMLYILTLSNLVWKQVSNKNITIYTRLQPLKLTLH